jgi:hypothetical protein
MTASTTLARDEKQLLLIPFFIRHGFSWKGSYARMM